MMARRRPVDDSLPDKAASPRREPPRPFSSPDSARFIDPYDDPVTAKYFRAVLQWHGYARFLGMPHLKENPDIPIDRLFVEPSLSKTPLIAQNYSADAPVESLESVIKSPGNERLVVLGDPGSGKTTLGNFLCWQLARREPNSWHDWLIDSNPARRPWPIPLVLRELRPERGVTWASLLDAFCRHPMNAQTEGLRPKLVAALERGQAFLFVDGLDEIGSAEVRDDLRAAIFDAFDSFPSCRWLLTSRVVGYEVAPFHQWTPAEKESEESASVEGENLPISLRVGCEPATLRYVAPFSDDQVERFALHWYLQREAAQDRAEIEVREFLQAIKQSDDTRHLARNPNLLTMMTLIYRVHFDLPSGRALLYAKIAETYLESIDKSRRLQPSPYSFKQKQAWLASVGFQMQMRRGAPAEGGPDKMIGDSVLATAEEVRSWLRDAMVDELEDTSTEEAEELLEYFSRRSGLLVPRGTDASGRELYAFTHLSFQEYFAACYLRASIGKPDWAGGGTYTIGARPEDLRRFARTDLWRESLLFLFELLDDADWSARLLEIIFDVDFQALISGSLKGVDAYSAVRLLGQVAVDRHIKLGGKLRRSAERHALVWSFSLEKMLQTRKSASARIPGVMLAWADPAACRRLVETINELLPNANGYLSLASSPIREIWSLANLSELRSLQLDRTSVSDLTPLAELTSLQTLNLNQTSVSDLTPLAELTSLQTLNLGQTSVSDLKPLAGLTSLETLYLNKTLVSDLTPLAGLTSLETLFLSETSVRDLGPLAGLTSLQTLYLHKTPVSDLTPLAGLTSLETLYLYETSVSDLGPLAGLTSLQTLFLFQTSVSELKPLAGLKRLNTLHLDATHVRDLEPIAGLISLTWLSLTQTLVHDVRPLAGLNKLRTLYLDRTLVSDVNPLARLIELQSLDLKETSVSDLTPLAHLTGLQSLNLNQTSVSITSRNELRKRLRNLTIHT
jgi:internalin A